jgi:hypothetical protein
MKSQQAQQLQYCCSEGLWNCERLLEDVALDRWAIVRTRAAIDRRHKTRLPQLNENKTKIKLNIKKL